MDAGGGGGAGAGAGGGGGSSKGGGGGGGNLSHLHSKINTLQQQLDKAKRNDEYIWNNEAGRWDYKKFGDPPNDTVLSLTNRLEIAKKSLKSAQTNNK